MEMAGVQRNGVALYDLIARRWAVPNPVGQRMKGFKSTSLFFCLVCCTTVEINISDTIAGAE